VEIPFKLAMPIFEEGKYKAARSYEELKEQIHSENGAFPIEKELLLRFYSITDEPAYERTGRFLIDTLNDPNYHSRDIGGHLSWKGRILNRARNKAGLAKAALGAKQDDRAEYFAQKMRQNRVTPRELREKLEAYKRMMK